MPVHDTVTATANFTDDAKSVEALANAQLNEPARHGEISLFLHQATRKGPPVWLTVSVNLCV